MGNQQLNARVPDAIAEAARAAAADAGVNLGEYLTRLIDADTRGRRAVFDTVFDHFVADGGAARGGGGWGEGGCGGCFVGLAELDQGVGATSPPAPAAPTTCQAVSTVPAVVRYRCRLCRAPISAAATRPAPPDHALDAARQCFHQMMQRSRGIAPYAACPTAPAGTDSAPQAFTAARRPPTPRACSGGTTRKRARRASRQPARCPPSARWPRTWTPAAA